MSKEKFNVKEAITSGDWLKIIDVDVQKGKELEVIRQMYDDRDKLLVQRIKELEEQLGLTDKAFKLAIFELDFYKNHSQTTNQETIERIEKLTDDIWNKAKEMKSE